MISKMKEGTGTAFLSHLFKLSWETSLDMKEKIKRHKRS
jgi:hypothetical protein